MASLWFLKLVLKCIDYLSWPVLALGYPLCASVQAIENESRSNTRNLISYWILLSLIYLFEYAFLPLLQWFEYWHYMKLIIIVCLMIPDFERASYVYNQLVRPCIYMKPHVVLSRFRNWKKKIFMKKEDFLIQTEKYITENGTEALEKLIASKSTEQSVDAETKDAVPTTEKNEIQKENKGSILVQMKNTVQNLDAETIKTVPTTEKDEMKEAFVIGSLDLKEMKPFLKTSNKVRFLKEQKDIKDLEMIEKEEVPEGKKANTALCSLKRNENTSSAIAKTEGMPVKDAEGGASPQISASKKVQKEWTCAICQLSTTCEANLNSHLQGRKHKAACEALKAKNQSVPVKVFMKKNDKPRGEPDKMINQSVAVTVITKKNDKPSGEPDKMINTSNASEQKITTSQHPKIEQKNVETVNVIEFHKPKKTTTPDQENKSKGVDANIKVQVLQKNVGKLVGTNNSRLRCDMPNVICNSQGDMASHLKGGKHLAQSQFLHAGYGSPQLPLPPLPPQLPPQLPSLHPLPPQLPPQSPQLPFPQLPPQLPQLPPQSPQLPFPQLPPQLPQLPFPQLPPQLPQIWPYM